MKGPVAHFPDAGIGLPPDVAHAVGDAPEDLAGVAIDRVVPLAVEPRGFEQPAVDIVLPLHDRAVADANRPRAPIALERKRLLVGPDAAVEPIQHVELRLGQGGRLHEPPELRSRFPVTSELQQRADDEIRVADPAEAIVPIAPTADRFRQRCCRGRHRRAGWREDQQLQHERAPLDEVGPWALVLALARPLLPEPDRSLEPGGDRRAPGKDQGFRVRRRQYERGPAAFADFEGRLGHIIAPRRRARIPTRDPDRIRAPRGDRNALPPLASRRFAPVIESRHETPAHRHRARHPFDRSHQLAHRIQVVVGQRQRVDDTDGALAGREVRFEDVGVGQVAS